MAGILVAALVAVAGILAQAVPAAAAANTYYVSSNASGASDANPGTQDLPWKTLEAVNRRTFAPGDTILFQRGATWSGLLTIKDSGTSTAPITVAGYGNGVAPHFTNPGPHNAIVVAGAYVTLDGILVSDADYSYTQLFGSGPQDSGGSVRFTTASSHGTVRNSEFTNVGEGVKLFGSNHTVTRNRFHDLRMAFQGYDAMFGQTSYGAIGVAVKGPGDQVSYNTFVNCRAASQAYGHDGGAIEIEAIGLPAGTDRNTDINHNTSTGSAGFLEIDSDDAFVDSTVAYNVVDDYQDFLLLFYRARVTVVNNTVVHTRYDAADSTNTVLTLPADVTGIMFANNIFTVGDGFTVLGAGNPQRRNNLYWNLQSGADPVGRGLGSGEQVADPRFRDFANRDLHLLADSPAIDAGSDEGLSRDYDDQPIKRAPDVGAFEWQGAFTQLISDGGFEAQTSSSLSAPWSKGGNVGTVGVDFTASKARAGRNNGWVATSSAGWNAVDQTVTVTGTTRYRLVAYVRSSGNFGSRGYFGITAPGIPKKEMTFGSTGAYANGYTRLELTFTSGGAGSATVYLGVADGDPSGSWVQVDDVSLSII